MTTTLITGVTGAVGSRYARRLLADPDRAVRVLVRAEEQVPPWWDLGAKVITGDLRDLDAVKRAVAGVDAVVHLAAAFRGGVSDEEAMAVNHAASVTLARAALAAGAARFVFASTTLVYGPGRGRPAREDDEPMPGHAYPASKVAAERDLLRLHRDEGLPLRIVRLAFVYGEGDPHLDWVRGPARSWPAHQRLQVVHHADVAQALTRALDTDGVDGRIYNVADDAPITAWDVLALGGEAPDAAAADRALDDPWQGIADTTRIREELGYRPTYRTVYAARDAGAM
ncbi:MAG: NAD(P)-dependent oxidoreductase [Micromonosporaceae bacterium]|jgi:nucleoside-diphosphate-sugar epimerase|nr:NAD(P)-dependent oxidoreductase [Micromonosporaceae bacterium]